MDHTIVHFEIPANDPERAAKFYRELFGWNISKWTSDGAPDYWMVSTVPTDARGMPTRPGVNGGLLRRQHAEHSPVHSVAPAPDGTTWASFQVWPSENPLATVSTT